MERIKNCLYCQKEFKAKRIDAKYCSDSCRQMSYRRESNPWTYGKVVPIYFELEDYQYLNLLERAEEADMHPNEFTKDLVVKSHTGLVSLFFTPSQISGLINPLTTIHGGISAEKLLRDWVLERARREMEGVN